MTVDLGQGGIVNKTNLLRLYRTQDYMLYQKGKKGINLLVHRNKTRKPTVMNERRKRNSYLTCHSSQQDQS